MRYEYHCIYCNHHWEEDRTPEYMDAPCVLPCPKCHDYGVNRVRAYANTINVKPGNCGNAENGYSGEVKNDTD